LNEHRPEAEEASCTEVDVGQQGVEQLLRISAKTAGRGRRSSSDTFRASKHQLELIKRPLDIHVLHEGARVVPVAEFDARSVSVLLGIKDDTEEDEADDGDDPSSETQVDECGESRRRERGRITKKSREEKGAKKEGRWKVKTWCHGSVRESRQRRLT
jgi:hypothetical protein